MQRRAAAVYVAVLSVIAVAAAFAVTAGLLPNSTSELWAVGALTGAAAVLLLAAAYMPVRGG